LGFAILTCFNPNLASTAEIFNSSQGIVIDGQIVSGDLKKLKDISRNLKNKKIILNSNGGQVLEALNIGKYIRNNGFATHLNKNSVCASACVILLAGGVVRSAEYGAEILIHVGSGLFNDDTIFLLENIIEEYGVAGATIMASKFEQTAAQVTLLQVMYFIESGVSIKLLERSLNIHHLEIKNITINEAKKYNLINDY
jgi:hypothetical protein